MYHASLKLITQGGKSDAQLYSTTLPAALLFRNLNLTLSPCPLSGLDINLCNLHHSGSLYVILSWTRICILTLLSIQTVFIMTKALILWLDDFCIFTGSLSLDPLLRSPPTSTSYCIQPANSARAARLTCYFSHRNSKLRPFLQELDHWLPSRLTDFH